jgi:tRNA threonylcarbamoyladenosine biosynthesis protein TsaB
VADANRSITARANSRGVAVRILAFDCATVRCSAAVWQNGAIRAHDANDAPYAATQALVPMLARVLAGAGIDLSAIDRLAVTVGPGHFTGLRAGLAVARGLVLATALPAVAVSTLEAIAAAVDPAERDGHQILVAIDSKRVEAYLQLFDAGLRPQSEPLARTPEDFAAGFRGEAPLLIAGDAGPRLADALRGRGVAARLTSGSRQPDAAVVAALGAARKPVSGPLRPFYLHPPAVKLPASVAAP